MKNDILQNRIREYRVGQGRISPESPENNDD